MLPLFVFHLLDRTALSWWSGYSMLRLSFFFLLIMCALSSWSGYLMLRLSTFYMLDMCCLSLWSGYIGLAAFSLLDSCAHSLRFSNLCCACLSFFCWIGVLFAAGLAISYCACLFFLLDICALSRWSFCYRADMFLLAVLVCLASVEIIWSFLVN